MSPTACILAARSNAVSRAQPSAASRAAAIAARASSRSPSATEPIVSPVAGLDAEDVSPVALGRHAPPMNMSSSVTVAIETLPVGPARRRTMGRTGQLTRLDN